MVYKGQRTTIQPNLILGYLQNRSRVQIWLNETMNLRLEGHIVGYDEKMNLVLANAEEIYIKTKTRKRIGKILLKGDNIMLIQDLDDVAVR